MHGRPAVVVMAVEECERLKGSAEHQVGRHDQTSCRTASTASAHYGLFANSNRAANIARARELLAVPSRLKEPETSKAAIDEPRVLLRPCPCCGGRMIIIETFARGCEPKHQPETTAPVIRIDTS